jgi:hypothetical protein
MAPGNTGVLRLVLRTQPRSVKFARFATILGDTDRVQLCATLNAYAVPEHSSFGGKALGDEPSPPPLRKRRGLFSLEFTKISFVRGWPTRLFLLPFVSSLCKQSA